MTLAFFLKPTKRLVYLLLEATWSLIPNPGPRKRVRQVLRRAFCLCRSINFIILKICVYIFRSFFLIKAMFWPLFDSHDVEGYFCNFDQGLKRICSYPLYKERSVLRNLHSYFKLKTRIWKLHEFELGFLERQIWGKNGVRRSCYRLPHRRPMDGAVWQARRLYQIGNLNFLVMLIYLEFVFVLWYEFTHYAFDSVDLL